MKKVIIGVLSLSFAPFILILVLALYLASYRHDYIINVILAKRLNKVAYAALPTNQNSFNTDIEELDGRAEKIRQFLHKYNSPLEPYYQDIVDAADQYGLDHRLIPAIAMQESNLCLKIPKDSHNCWGFGIYGGKVTRFADYKEGIYTVTKTLALKYKDKGLVTPEEIMTMWTPSSNGSWAFSVNHFMDELE